MRRLKLAVALSAAIVLLTPAAAHAVTQGASRIRTAEIVGVAKRPGLPKGVAADRVFVEGATISVRHGSVKGDEFTRAKADARGRFAIPVPPGTYYLIPLSPPGDARGPVGKPVKVTARAGRTTEVTLFYPRR